MKIAVSTENGQKSRSYCIWWRRAGAQDRFRHWVLADSIDEAVRQSRLDVTKALGTNAGLWKIEESEKQITAPMATEVVSWESGRSSDWVGIIAFAVLLLGLFFLFHSKSNEAASAGPVDGESLFERITK